MLLVTGEVERIIEREAGNSGNTWIERTVVVRDWGSTTYVVAGRELNEGGTLPAQGDKVVLEVSVNAYVRQKDGKAGFGYTGHRRNSELEGSIFGKAAPLRAAQ